MPVFITILTLLVLFLAMIVVGFVRFRKPESGWLLIVGFLGLAALIFIAEIIRFAWVDELGRAGILSFDSRSNIYWYLSPHFCGWIPMVVLLTLFVVGWFNPNHKFTRRLEWAGIGGFLIYLVLALGYPSDLWPLVKSTESATRAGVYDIKNALVEYASEHDGLYPENIETLLDENYLRELPENPFNYEPMRDVPYGSPDFEGNFTYLPIISDGEVHDYFLICYGDRYNPGMHLVNPDVDDHSIMVTQNREFSSSSEEEFLTVIRDVIQSTVMTEF